MKQRHSSNFILLRAFKWFYIIVHVLFYCFETMNETGVVCKSVESGLIKEVRKKGKKEKSIFSFLKNMQMYTSCFQMPDSNLVIKRNSL